MTAGIAEANRKLVDALQRLEQDDVSGAVDLTEEALSLSPAYSAAVHVLGLAAIKMNELLRAEELLRVAHDLAPNIVEHTEVLAIINARLERMHDALYFGKLGAVLKPHGDLSGLVPDWLGTYEDAMHKIDRSDKVEAGAGLMRAGRFQAAVKMYQSAVEAAPGDERGWRGLRDALIAADQPVEALFAAQAISSKGQVEPADLSSAAGILTQLGQFDEAQGCHFEAVKSMPGDAEVRSAMIRDLTVMPDTDLEDLERAERLWEISFARETERNLLPHQTGAPLRLGVLSGRLLGFRGLDLIWPLFTDGRAGKAEVMIYNATTGDDAFARRIRGSVDRWTDIADIDDRTVSRIIRNDAVDVLIDLDGHRRGGRMELVGRRPAPVVISWFGAPNPESAVYDFWLTRAGFSKGDGTLVAALETSHAPPAGAALEPPAPRFPGAALRVGIAGGLRKLNDAFLSFLDDISATGANIEFVAMPALLGGVSGLDVLDKALDRHGLSGRVSYSAATPAYHEALSVFLGSCDILVDPGPDADMMMMWEAFSRSIPVLFADPADDARFAEGAAFLAGEGLSGCLYSGHDDLQSRLIALAGDAAAVDALSRSVHDAAVKAVAPDTVAGRSGNFIDALASLAAPALAGGG